MRFCVIQQQDKQGPPLLCIAFNAQSIEPHSVRCQSTSVDLKQEQKNALKSEWTLNASINSIPVLEYWELQSGPPTAI